MALVFVIALIVLIIALSFFFKKKETPSFSPDCYPRLSYSELFQIYIKAGNDLLATMPMFTGNRFEIMPFLTVIGFLSVQDAGGDTRKYSDEIYQYFTKTLIGPESSFLNERIPFYCDIASGAPILGLWSVSELPPSVLSIPMLRCTVAFGDCITNPDCIKDYEHAPVLLADITEKASFSQSFTQDFFRFVKTYCTAVAGGKFAPTLLAGGKCLPNEEETTKIGQAICTSDKSVSNSIPNDNSSNDQVVSVSGYFKKTYSIPRSQVSDFFEVQDAFAYGGYLCDDEGLTPTGLKTICPHCCSFYSSDAKKCIRCGITLTDEMVDRSGKKVYWLEVPHGYNVPVPENMLVFWVDIRIAYDENIKQ